MRDISAPARGHEREFTAQPRPLSDDIGQLARDEEGESLAPEDLGSHFLSEAVVQGDSGARDLATLELAMLEDAEPDEAPSSDAEIAAWSRLVQLAAEGGRASKPLWAAAAYGIEALEAARESPRKPRPQRAVRLHDSSIREASLLDHEGAESDETWSPEIEVEDGGRHARAGHDHGSLEHRPELAAEDGGPRARKLSQVAHSKLRSAAGKIRGLTQQLSKKARR
jgi:hypothetical protein